MSHVAFTNKTAQVTCDAEVPSGFSAYQRLSPGLAYPFDLGGMSSVPFTVLPDPDEGGFPRIDLLPARGMLVWLVSFDDRVERDPTAAPPYDGTAIKGVPPVTPRDASVSHWENVRMWRKLIPLGASKRCGVFAFAGTSSYAPTDMLPQLLAGLSFKG